MKKLFLIGFVMLCFGSILSFDPDILQISTKSNSLIVFNLTFADEWDDGSGQAATSNDTNIATSGDSKDKCKELGNMMQDFEGVIPKPGQKYYDENCRVSRDIGEAIQNGDVELADIPVVIVKWIDLFTKIAGTLAVIFVIYSGFQYVISGISDDKEGAKSTIKNVIIGLVIAFGPWLLVQIIFSVMLN